MLRALLDGLAELVYPKTCVACKARLKNKPCVDNIICAGCWAKIKRNVPPFCLRCGRHLEKTNITKSICPSCLKVKLHFDRAFSPCIYEGVIKELVQGFKYRNKDYLGHSLSRLLAEFIREYNLPLDYMDYIVPVPLHKTRLREREFNQAEILSKHIAQDFKKELLADALTRNRPTKTQTELETGARHLNVKGSFSTAKSDHIKGKSILLVDDVLTTGATASEAALALKNAGANIVFVLTLAN